MFSVTLNCIYVHVIATYAVPQVRLMIRGKHIQGFSQDFETISHFCGTDFFFIIMNKQEYIELNLIISYVALLVSNGD